MVLHQINTCATWLCDAYIVRDSCIHMAYGPRIWICGSCIFKNGPIEMTHLDEVQTREHIH